MFGEEQHWQWAFTANSPAIQNVFICHWHAFAYLMKNFFLHLSKLFTNSIVIVNSEPCALVLPANAGGGRAFNNNLANRLLMLLVYYRLYFRQGFRTLLFKDAFGSILCRNTQQLISVNLNREIPRSLS